MPELFLSSLLMGEVAAKPSEGALLSKNLAKPAEGVLLTKKLAKPSAVNT